MNEPQMSRMSKDLDQIMSPVETTIITKHYCFSFISFLLGEFKEDIQHVLEDSDKYEGIKKELQMLRLNRVLGHCPYPDECEEYDFCEDLNCIKGKKKPQRVDE